MSGQGKGKRQNKANGKPLIEAKGVTRVLPGPVPVTLVKDVDLTIRGREFVAVTGPSGSGKSSLLYLLGLLDRPDQGSIRLEGTDTGPLATEALSDIRLARLGFIFQFHFLLPEFTVEENVMIPMRRLGGRSVEQMRARAKAILEELDLADQAAKRPHQLSGGQMQRVAVARALANDPPILLADEPTGNLDTKNAERVADVFERLVRDEERTVVMVTHNPELAARTGRQIRIVDGRIVEDTGGGG
ncbi:MAG: ABC transporter ATP-binding protein [Rhodospirillales bacterium]